MPQFNDLQCPSCERFFGTQKGLTSHLSTACSCQWYHKGKIRSLTDINIDLSEPEPCPDPSSDVATPDGPISWTDVEPVNFEDLSWPYFDDEDYFDTAVPPLEDHNRDEFQLIDESGAGPGPQTIANAKMAGRTRALDDDDDLRHVEEHPTAGMAVPLSSEHGTDASGDITIDNPSTSPFSNIAEWVVKESVGHASVNRLLAIPGVYLMLFSTLYYLTFKQVVDKLGLYLISAHYIRRWMSCPTEQVHG